MADRNLEIALRIKADLESARKQLDELNKSVKATGDNSQGSADKLKAVGQRIGEMEAEAAQANKTLGQTGAVAETTAGKTKNLGTQVAQLAVNLKNGNLTSAAGNIGRIGASSGVAANSVGLLAAGIGTAAAVLAVLAVAAVKGYKEEQQLNRDIIATGNYAGVTTAKLREMASEISGPVSGANTALRLLVASGRVVGEQLQQSGQAAVNLSTLTGISIDKAVAQIVRLQDDPVRAVKALDDQYHLLTASQYEAIKALADQGNAEDAAALAQESVASALAGRTAQVRENLGLLERAWAEVRDTASAAWNAMNGVGRTSSNQDDLAAADKQLQAIKDRLPQTKKLTDAQLLAAAQNSSDPNHAFFAGDLGSIQLAIAQKQASQAGAQWEAWIASTEATSTRANDALKRDSDFWDHALAGAKSDAAKQKEIAAVNAAAARDTKLAPNQAAQFEQQRQDALALIEKKYAAKETTPRAGADNSAAIARAAAAAVDQQVQSLARLQGALDPAAKAWAEYNAEVAKQDKIAATAKAAPGADVAAIDARRNATVQAAAAVRDADLAALAKKDQDAWDKLRESLRTPTEVKLDTAAAQIAELNRLIASGVDAGGQYAAMLDKIARASVVSAPRYQGVDAVVSGPAGELIKNVQAQQALDAWHAQQLAANQAFRERDIANEEAANARKLEIEEQFTAQKAQIDQARGQLTLATANAGFGALANAAKAAYGEQSKQYRIAFALQKAAALAQSILAIQTSIAESSKIGFPWNIVTIAGAVAQGVAVLATINSTTLGGYATGGYTGAGGKYQVRGYVHAGEGVLSQEDIAAIGGPAAFEAFRRSLHGYADGGFVQPLANAPAAPSFRAPTAPRIAANDGNGGQPNKMRVYVLQNEDQLAQRLAQHPAMEKRIVAVASENGTAIRAEW